MKNYLALLCFGIITLMAMTSKEEVTRIGLASASNILNQIPRAQLAQASLDTLKQALDVQFQVKVDELRQKQQAFDAEKSTLNENVRVDKEAELQALQQSIVQFQTTAGEAYQQKESELMSPILENFHSALESVAEDQGFTHIFNVDAAGGSSLLLYAKDYARVRVDSLILVTINTNNINNTKN